jgi:hypothetical protein
MALNVRTSHLHSSICVPNTFTHSDFNIVQSSLQDVRLVIKLTSLFQSFKSLGGVCYKSLAPFPIHAR